MDASTSPAEGPVPSDRGAEDHLRGAVVSPLVLPATSGRLVDLAGVAHDPLALFVRLCAERTTSIASHHRTEPA